MQLHLQITPFGQALADRAESADGAACAGPLSFRLHTRMEALEDAWRALEADDALSLHQGYDWCHAWAESHGGRILVIEGVAAGRTRLLLPLEIDRLGPLRIARLLASDFSNINTGLYAPSLRALAASGELDEAFKQARSLFARHFDLLLLDKMPLAWRGAQSPFAAFAGVVNQNAAFQLPLLADFEQTLAQLNAKRRRKKFRTSERRLSAIGGYEHVMAASGKEAADILETFFRQKAARFDAMGLKGENEGRILAIAGLSRKGDHVICQFGSIDETIAADASPGELLFYLAIRQLNGEGVRLFDFGIGDQPYKRSWCTQETPQHDLFWAATGAGRAAAVLHRMKTGAKRFIKQNAKAYSFVQRLRSGRQKQAVTDTDAD